MGCGASKSAEVSNEKKDEKKEETEEKKPEEGATSDEAAKDDSVVKNHPPKPAQRLEEQPKTILRVADLTVPELLPTINSSTKGEETEGGGSAATESA